MNTSNIRALPDVGMGALIYPTTRRTMNTFKTPKGTILPLMNLQGKDYLQVAHRLVWFREEHPDWRVQTDLHTFNAQYALVKASILDQSGNVLSQAYKTQLASGFKNFLEKAETGAIGRALALVGYGTQFCGDEFDEGEDIADAPVVRAVPPPSISKSPVSQMVNGINYTDLKELREYTIKFGNEKGFKLFQKPASEWLKYTESFKKWLTGKSKKPGPDVLEFEQVLDAYIALSEQGEDSPIAEDDAFGPI